MLHFEKIVTDRWKSQRTTLKSKTEKRNSRLWSWRMWCCCPSGSSIRQSSHNKPLDSLQIIAVHNRPFEIVTNFMLLFVFQTLSPNFICRLRMCVSGHTDSTHSDPNPDLPTFSWDIWTCRDAGSSMLSLTCHWFCLEITHFSFELTATEPCYFCKNIAPSNTAICYECKKKSTLKWTGKKKSPKRGPLQILIFPHFQCGAAGRVNQKVTRRTTAL